MFGFVVGVVFVHGERPCEGVRLQRSSGEPKLVSQICESRIIVCSCTCALYKGEIMEFFSICVFSDETGLTPEGEIFVFFCLCSVSGEGSLLFFQAWEWKIMEFFFSVLSVL